MYRCDPFDSWRFSLGFFHAWISFDLFFKGCHQIRTYLRPEAEKEASNDDAQTNFDGRVRREPAADSPNGWGSGGSCHLSPFTEYRGPFGGDRR